MRGSSKILWKKTPEELSKLIEDEKERIKIVGIKYLFERGLSVFHIIEIYGISLEEAENIYKLHKKEQL